MNEYNLPDNGLPTILGTFTFLRVDGQTLMMKRDKDSTDFLYGKCVAPGGKIEDIDKTPEDCAHRECFEETDLTLIRPLTNRGRVFFDNKNRNFGGKPAKFNFLVYIFESNSYTGSLDYNKDPKGTPIWVPNNKLRDLPIERGDHFIIDWIEQGVIMNHRIILSDKDARYESLG